MLLKFKRFIICIFLVLILSIMQTNAEKTELPMKNKTIFVDAGHGGLDPGTLYDDVYEKDINLKITLYLKKYLEDMGATVYMTRDGDYDLSKPNARYRKKSDFDNRIKLINQSNANYYLSIHLNFLEDKEYYGPQVFYNQEFAVNQTLAETLQKNLNEKLNTNRQIKTIPNKTYMYSKLKIPGVLIECGFLSNDGERSRLKTSEYQMIIASIIAETMKDF